MLIAIETTVPPYKIYQSHAAEELKKRMTSRDAVNRLIDAAAANSGIETRYIVIPDAEAETAEQFYSDKGIQVNPGTKRRMEEYEKWTKQLACEAVGKLLKKTEIPVEKINRMITISCTGFFAPGLDNYLMQNFNLPATVKRTNIGFMGCAASVNGFNSVFESINAVSENEESYTLMVSVELCSLHLHTEPTRDNILSNIIFADGCAAALFSKSHKPGTGGPLSIKKTSSFLFQNSEKYMAWKIGDFGFDMVLSSELPKVILATAAPVLKNILDTWGLKVSEIRHWALHPGGRAIIDAMQAGLGLTDAQTEVSRQILRNYGNMSSATIMFVLKEFLDSGRVRTDEYLCAVAFGPGLTMEVALFQGNNV